MQINFKFKKKKKFDRTFDKTRFFIHRERNTQNSVDFYSETQFMLSNFKFQ